MANITLRVGDLSSDYYESLSVVNAGKVTNETENDVWIGVASIVSRKTQRVMDVVDERRTPEFEFMFRY